MPNPMQARMEDMSFAYIQAICANNGYDIARTSHDNDCIDCTIECCGYPKDNAGCIMYSPKVDVQLKASFANVVTAPNGDILYDLSARNYNYLVNPNRFTPYILVLLVMHKEKRLWLEHNLDWLKITKCAYWVCLKGQKPTENKSSQRIVIPSTNILSPSSLQDIMVKISKQELL